MSHLLMFVVVSAVVCGVFADDQETNSNDNDFLEECFVEEGIYFGAKASLLSSLPPSPIIISSLLFFTTVDAAVCCCC